MYIKYKYKSNYKNKYKKINKHIYNILKQILLVQGLLGTSGLQWEPVDRGGVRALAPRTSSIQSLQTISALLTTSPPRKV